MNHLLERNRDGMQRSSYAQTVDLDETGIDLGVGRTVWSESRCSLYLSKRFFEMKGMKGKLGFM